MTAPGTTSTCSERRTWNRTAGTNPVERLRPAVTVDFFDRYVLGQPDALKTMTRDGYVSCTAALVGWRAQPPP